MPQEDIVALQSALLSLSLKCYRDQSEYGNKVLENTRKIFDDLAGDTKVQTGTQAAKELVKMLKIPLDCYDILDVLKLNHYKLILQLLSYRERHTVCMYITNSILEKETIVPTAEQVTQLLDLLSTLIIDQSDGAIETSRQTISNEDFVEEQNLVARLCNNFKASTDPDQQYHIIKICQDTFKNGGLERMRFTYPPIIMQAYALTYRYKQIREQDEKWEKKCQKLFQLCNQLINTLTKLETHDLPLRLHLQGALVASEIGSENAETIAYEFFSQAYTLYEEQAGDSRAQCASLTLLIGTLEKVRCFGEENHSTLRQSLTQAATRLVKRPDQVQTLLLCTHLFWSAERVSEGAQKPEPVRDDEKVLACLKKAAKLTTQVMDHTTQIQLYHELLNSYIYFFNQNHPGIDISVLNSSIEKLQSELSKSSSSDSDEFTRKQIQKTFDYLRQQSSLEKFQGLQINN
jgi:vacuolar protein sorting-associated protein 35